MTAAEPRDRYQPETRLEAGLGGERWLATDRQTGKVVWLGVLDARAANEAHQKAFDAWTRVAPTLSHPSLERFLDSGTTALGNPYFAVESTDAETLAVRLDREPAMSVHELVRVVTAVVDGLLVAHRVGLVHGDIAPDRVHLLAGGRARLAGFGMNRAVARSQDASREAATLPHGDAYMSPEQASGGEATAASDTWSVAAILYRGVTGIPPRAQIDGRSTCVGIVEGPTRPVLELRPDLPNSFVQLLEKALAADPGKRFKDTAELRKALTSALILAPAVARLPVMASPLPPDSGEGLEKSAPALPPAPTRAKVGIGPLSRARGAEPDTSSTLAALAPVALPQDSSRASDAPPSLVPRETDPPIEDAELLEEDDDEGLLTSAAPRSVHPPAPLAERVSSAPKAPVSAKRSDPPPLPPAHAPGAAQLPPVPRVPSAASDTSAAPQASPGLDWPSESPGLAWPSASGAGSESAELPEFAPASAAMFAAPEPVYTPSDPDLSASAASDAMTSLPPPRPGLPAKAWAAIGTLAIGAIVAISGGARFMAGSSSDETTGATVASTTGSTRGTSIEDDAPQTGTTQNAPPIEDAVVDAGAPAVAVVIDAGAPAPAVEPPIPAPTEPVVNVTERSTGTTRTGTTGTTNVAPAMMTATPMVETPMTTPMVETPMTTPMVETPMTTPMVEAPMTAPMTDTSMHALERDPGF